MLINKLRISQKIFVVIAVTFITTFMSIVMSMHRLRTISESYSDQVERVDYAITSLTRGNRFLTAYGMSAYGLAGETTDEGNRKLLAEVKKFRDASLQEHMYARTALPEYANRITPVIEALNQAFNDCESAINNAAGTTSPDEAW